MKNFFLLFILTIQFSYSQNATKFLSLERSYYNNESVMSSYTDKLNLEYDFINNYSLKSEFSMANLNFLDLSNYYVENIRTLYSLDFNIDRKIKLKNNWSINLGVTPQLRSNFENEINSNDFIFNAYVKTNKIFANKSSLMISLTYGTLLGESKPYLEFEYYLPINNKINLSVGFPKSYLEYNLNKNHSISVQSSYEGYFTNVSQNSFSRIYDNELLTYESLFFSRINNSFKYEYKFSNLSAVNFTVGKSFKNELEVVESKNQITEYQFTNIFNVSIGFKYNLNFK